MKKVRIEELASGMIMAKSIYSNDGRILVREQTVLNESLIDRLREMGLPAAYIKVSARPALSELVSDIARVDLIRSMAKLDTNVRSGQKLDLLDSRKAMLQLIDEIVKTRKEQLPDFPDIRLHSGYIYGHSVNVCVLAVKLGVELGYNQIRLADLAVGALFHDIGMTRVSRGILDKTAPLSGGEMDVIRKHPEDGYKLLKDVHGLSAVASNVAYQHHERFNGSGYPRGLSGKNILEFARIAAIVDVFDSLTTEKVYRPAISSRDAFHCINAKAGTEFDPELVEVFARLIQ